MNLMQWFVLTPKGVRCRHITSGPKESAFSCWVRVASKASGIMTPSLASLMGSPHGHRSVAG
jgi:hypothetical protein